MKNENIMSFILTNSLFLLLLGTALSSCQKQSFHSTGHYSQLVERSRMPASVKKSFKQFQDPKQIYLYCKASDLNVESCYKLHLTKKAQSFMRKNPGHALDSIIEKHSFEYTKEQLKKIDASLVKLLKPQIDNKVEIRKKYCDDNAVMNKKRCHQQFLNKESLSISNEYQDSQNLRGYEFLHLNNLIKSQIQKKLI